MPDTPLPRLNAFKRAQEIRQKYNLRGMLTLEISPPYRIELKFCPETWEMPDRFLAEFCAIPGPNLILGLPVEHIPYHKAWVDCEFGQHLIALRQKAAPQTPPHRFLTEIIRFLHIPGIGECLAQETPPRCEREAFERWSDENHPVQGTLTQVLA